MPCSIGATCRSGKVIRARRPLISTAESTPDPGSGQAPSTLDRALALVRFLRANCPWDAAQTPATLTPYLLEEAHEVVEAIEDDDDDALASELGDLLLNLAFQIVLAEERGSFNAATVVDAMEAKMRRRHPHLYGLGEAEEWETLKAREREASAAGGAEGGEGAEGATGPGRIATTTPGDAAVPPSILTGLPRGLDPLSRAHRIQERVSSVGFDWADAQGAFAKVAEELEEVREALEAEPSPALEEELGDLLFAVVNLTRLAGTHALNALQRANRKFSDRFTALEALAAERGVILGEASLEALDALWDEVKRTTRGEGGAR